MNGKRLLDESSTAPDFELPVLKGGSVRLLDERPTVVAFFKVSCPTCQLSLPFFERLSKTSKTHRVLGVSQDPTDDTSEFAARFGITFPLLLDTAEAGYPASNAYGLSHVPSVFLVEPDGSISWSMEGFDRMKMEDLGRQTGGKPFAPGEFVPEWKSG